MSTQNVAGLGVDIVEIARMEAVLRRSPAFGRRAFTEGERAYCDAKVNPATHYALRFAGKEAVLKALGCGFSKGIGPRDVEILNNERGKPFVVLHRRAAEVAAEAGIEQIHVSLSYTHTTAIANALAAVAAPPVEEAPDPKAELAAAFKEVRSVLDDLDALGAQALENVAKN